MKNILITGSTGTIGETLVRLFLEQGYEVYAPVRNIEKAQSLFGASPAIHFEKRNLEDYEDMEAYAQSCASKGIVFDVALFLAGDLVRDSKFPGNSDEEKYAHSCEYHERVNVLTAQTILEGLSRAYGANLKHATGFITSSWAVTFAQDDPKRKISGGYAHAKALLETVAHNYEHLFNSMIIDRPALIISTITIREFPELIQDPNVPKLTAEEYLPHVRKLLGI